MTMPQLVGTNGTETCPYEAANIRVDEQGRHGVVPQAYNCTPNLNTYALELYLAET